MTYTFAADSFCVDARGARWRGEVLRYANGARTRAERARINVEAIEERGLLDGGDGGDGGAPDGSDGGGGLDASVSTIAFRTTRAVAAGEELVVDYGDEVSTLVVVVIEIVIVIVRMCIVL